MHHFEKPELERANMSKEDSEHMNPAFPARRGCFIDNFTDPAKATLVDYPTWQAKNGNWVPGANEPIRSDLPWKKDFATFDEAKAFAEAENYLVCQLPKSLDPRRKNEKPEPSNSSSWDF